MTEHDADRDTLALAVFFVVAFGISWAGWIALQILLASKSEAPIVFYLFYAGVVVSPAGLLAAAVAGGRPELGRILRDTVRIDAGLTTWALVVAVPVVWIVASALIYSASYGGPGRIDIPAFWASMTRPQGLLNLAYPIGEEIGWRGFLLPLLMKRRSPLSAALIVGAVWAIWHVPFYWTRILENPAWFVNFCFGVMCLSVIFAGIYVLSRSVLATIALHWHINAIQDANEHLFPDLPSLGGGSDPYALTMSAVIFAIAVIFAFALRPANVAATSPPSAR
jgi:membrane protease YdiL (CAAX protease family)